MMRIQAIKRNQDRYFLCSCIETREAGINHDRKRDKPKVETTLVLLVSLSEQSAVLGSNCKRVHSSRMKTADSSHQLQGHVEPNILSQHKPWCLPVSCTIDCYECIYTMTTHTDSLHNTFAADLSSLLRMHAQRTNDAHLRCQGIIAHPIIIHITRNHKRSRKSTPRQIYLPAHTWLVIHTTCITFCGNTPD